MCERREGRERQGACRLTGRLGGGGEVFACCDGGEGERGWDGVLCWGKRVVEGWWTCWSIDVWLDVVYEGCNHLGALKSVNIRNSFGKWAPVGDRCLHVNMLRSVILVQVDLAAALFCAGVQILIL